MPAERQKVAKTDVNYRVAKAGAKRKCGTCAMFNDTNYDGTLGTCDLVKGLIHSEDVCDRWVKK